MNAEQFVWQVIGLCTQPAWMAVCSSALAKAIWSGELRSSGLLRLIAATFSIDTGIALGWLVATQHDGRLAADGTMVVATACYLAWAMRR